ncbi:MAG: hypothetical protein AAF497_06520, partial [Planctomycetota bacterium]
EPAALTALTLLAHDRPAAAQAVLDWLADIQSDDGYVGITSDQAKPRWPTSLAVLAWNHHARVSGSDRFKTPVKRGIDGLLSIASHTSERTKNVTHDTTIEGWPWAEGTHAWIEPTAFALMAMKSCGLERHQRAADATRLLLDRQLPRGGCNYGNTFVLGQQLLPHLQPTGISALALAGVADDPRLQKSLRYLESFWRQESGTASRAYAVMGLAAHGRTPDDLTSRFEKSGRRLLEEPSGAYRAALVTLAVLGDKNPLVMSQLSASPSERKESA